VEERGGAAEEASSKVDSAYLQAALLINQQVGREGEGQLRSRGWRRGVGQQRKHPARWPPPSGFWCLSVPTHSRLVSHAAEEK
jgi:hypothetical protein